MNAFEEAARIMEALRGIDGIRSVSDAWPETADPRPCITVTLAGEKTTDRRDGKPYLKQREFYLRLFIGKKQGFVKLAMDMEATMEALGYEQTFLWEEPSNGARQLVCRYQQTT